MHDFISSVSSQSFHVDFLLTEFMSSFYFEAKIRKILKYDYVELPLAIIESRTRIHFLKTIHGH